MSQAKNTPQNWSPKPPHKYSLAADEITRGKASRIPPELRDKMSDIAICRIYGQGASQCKETYTLEDEQCGLTQLYPRRPWRRPRPILAQPAWRVAHRYRPLRKPRYRAGPLLARNGFLGL